MSRGSQGISHGCSLLILVINQRPDDRFKLLKIPNFFNSAYTWPNFFISAYTTFSHTNTVILAHFSYDADVSAAEGTAACGVAQRASYLGPPRTGPPVIEGSA